jgi:hypothetical protein
MNLYFPMEEYEARWARVERSMIDRGYDVAVVWSRSGGTFDRCGDVLYPSNYVDVVQLFNTPQLSNFFHFI